MDLPFNFCNLTIFIKTPLLTLRIIPHRDRGLPGRTKETLKIIKLVDKSYPHPLTIPVLVSIRERRQSGP